MTRVEVELQELDSDYLVSNKTIHFGEKWINAPFAAQVPEKWTRNEIPLEESRGFNEFFRRLDPDRIVEKEDQITREIRKTDPREGEISTLFVSLKGEKKISKDELYSLIRIQNNTCDFLTVPLRSDLIDAINSDEKNVDEDLYVERYIDTFNKFLESAVDLGCEKEIMGIIPVLDWKYSRKVIHKIAKEELKLVCVNFNGRSPTVDSQFQNVISPYLNEFSDDDRLLDIFSYAINADRGNRNIASDFLATAMGFDAIGGYHTPIKGDEEYLKKLNNKEKETFRVFKCKRFRHIEPQIEELEQHFPVKTNLDVSRIKSKAKNGNAADSRKVLQSEQFGRAANDLRQSVTQKTVKKLLEERLEEEGPILNRLRKIRHVYENGTRQSGMDEYSDV